MADNKIVDKAYKEALRVLQNCLHPLGMKASAKVRGYPQVWARDSMISLLGALLVDDETIRRVLRASITTLRNYQSSLGIIPNNVDVRTQKANFQAYADGGLWFVIGNEAFFKTTGDKKFLKQNYAAIKKTLHWYEYQDGEQSGLVSMGEAADWEDLFAVRDKSLYLNVLYYKGLLTGAEIARALGDSANYKLYTKKARDLVLCINKKFWYFEKKNIREIIKHNFGTEDNHKKTDDALDRKLILPPKTLFKKDSYYLHYITFRNFGERFDAFGNILAILTGVANKEKSHQILKFIKKYKLIEPYPIQAVYPPVFPNEKEWRYYYEFGKLNFPHQYHNGGIWPFLGGFYIAALVKIKKYEEAKKSLVALALLNRKGVENEWEFNEWFHGKNGKPMGMAEQAWSAGMYIYAYWCVKKKKVL